MILNLLTVTAFVGVAAANYGGASYDAPNTFFLPRHHYRGHRWRSSSSSSSEEKWHCARLGVFNVTAPEHAPKISAPKIAYFTHQGNEKAIVVCQDPQIQLLFGKSRDANVDIGITGEYKDNALLSVSTMSGIVLNCNKKEERYEAFNLFTEKTIPIESVACYTTDESTARDTIEEALGSFDSD